MYSASPSILNRAYPSRTSARSGGMGQKYPRIVAAPVTGNSAVPGFPGPRLYTIARLHADISRPGAATFMVSSIRTPVKSSPDA